MSEAERDHGGSSGAPQAGGGPASAGGAGQQHPTAGRPAHAEAAAMGDAPPPGMAAAGASHGQPYAHAPHYPPSDPGGFGGYGQPYPGAYQGSYPPYPPHAFQAQAPGMMPGQSGAPMGGQAAGPGYAPGAGAGPGPGPGPQAGMQQLFEEIAQGGNGLNSLTRMLSLDDTEFWKGALVGAAAVMLLTNDQVQDALFKSGAKAKRAVKSGADQFKERASASARTESKSGSDS